ncbi:MAG: pseudoazurin [Pseudomonadota bacterium]
MFQRAKSVIAAAGGALLLTLAGALTTAHAEPTVHEIQMLNGDPENRRERMVFRPDLVVAKPGDIIKFIPTDPSHQSSSIDGMLPAGAEGWKGKTNEAIEVTLTEPGVYGYKCVPHYAGGMVGLVIVEGDGMTENVEAAKKVRQVGLAGRRFDNIWERASEYVNQ